MARGADHGDDHETSDDQAGVPPTGRSGRRRTFSAEYKLRVLVEYDAAVAPGGKKAVLEREGLHTAHIVEWRRAREAGALAELAKPRGRRRPDPRDAELERLRREASRLESELARARTVIEVQGKVCALLETASGSAHGWSGGRTSRPASRRLATLRS